MRVRRLHREFALTLDARVTERTTLARELHDTLLQSFHGLIPRLQIVSELLPDRPADAKKHVDRAMELAAHAVTEGRDAVQGLRASTVQMNDLARGIRTLGEELAADSANDGSPMFSVTVEGESRDLHPILRDEVYRIAGESLRNAFRHAQAQRVEVEIRYDDEQFRLRVRDDGKGIDPKVLSGHAPEGHFDLAGLRERARAIGGKLSIWSEVGAGTEVELQIPAGARLPPDCETVLDLGIASQKVINKLVRRLHDEHRHGSDPSSCGRRSSVVREGIAAFIAIHPAMELSAG